MTQSYFLGANSAGGFVPLYAEFPPDDSFLHIIKGGPGTGKSGFMRKIGNAAEAHGCDVHYVLCSGDPDSLDAVFIPALHAAWVDGTAPHVTEPGIFAVNSDYVNLGRFCRLPVTREDGERIVTLSGQYKALYRQSYAWLAAAAAMESTKQESASESEAALDAILDFLPPDREEAAGRQSRRFLHALSCKGDLRLSGEIEKLCKLIIQVSDPQLLRCAAHRRGAAILCPSPLRPEIPEAVLFPDVSLAVVDSGWTLPVSRSLIASDPPTTEAVEAEQLKTAALAFAFDKLRQAKALHDEMEHLYGGYMDFDALTAFTDRVTAQLFA